MADDYLAQGIAAVKAGKKQEARRLLDAAIRTAPNDVRTWGWFYNVCENDNERLRCVKEILRIEPNNEKAKQKYDKLIGLGYQTSEAVPKRALTPDATNKKQGLSLEWIVFGGIIGLAILGIAVVGIIFLFGKVNSQSASIPNIPPTQYSPQLTVYPSATLLRLPSDTPKTSTTPLPTKTSFPTNTPRPTNTKIPVRGTLNNPYPFNELIHLVRTVDNRSIDFSVQITKIIRGRDALVLIQQANMFNDAPPPGSEPIMVQIYIKNDSLNQNLSLNEFDFQVVTGGKIIAPMDYFVCCLENIGYPNLDFSLLPGAETTGWITSKVDIDDSRPMMVIGVNILTSQGGLYFSLTP